MTQHRVVRSVDEGQTWQVIATPPMDETDLQDFFGLMMQVAVPMNMEHDGNGVFGMFIGPNEHVFISYEVIAEAVSTGE